MKWNTVDVKRFPVSLPAKERYRRKSHEDWKRQTNVVREGGGLTGAEALQNDNPHISVWFN